jgi:hypothetical protein
MKHLHAAALIAAITLLAACGTTPKTDAPAAAPVAQPTSVAIAQPVRIPAAASRTVVLNMTGPKAVTEAKDWASFKEEWRATFAEHAKAQGIAFSMQQGDVRPAAAPGTVLDVVVNDYRQVGIGARIFLGVMTGNAYIDAKVTYADLNGGAVFGQQTYSTSSTAWAGVFAKMTPQQVDAIATEVFTTLKPR